MKGLALAVVIAVVPVVARAGNLDGVFVSDQAAMMAGAVTAIASDTTATYYNPAGLAKDLSHSSISVTTSSYGVSTRSSSPFIVSGERFDASFTTLQLLSVPAAISYVKPLTPRLGLGLGIFVPVAENSWQRDRTSVGTDTDGAAISYESRIVGSEYRLGGGVGYALTDTLRLGAGLFAIYRTSTVHFDFGGLQTSGGQTVSASTISINNESLQFGALATLGAQWQVTPRLSVALTWFLPQVQLASSDRISQQAITAAPGELGASNSFQEVTSGRRAGGFTRVFVGVGYEVPTLRIGVEGSVAKPKGDSVYDVLWNARAGFQIRVREDIWLGGGLFTDRSPYRFRAGDLFSSGIDFYGATTGVRLESHYVARLLHDWLDGSAVDDSSIVFYTTVTTRYAYGNGRSAVIYTNRGSDPVIDGIDTTIHEVSAQLSTGVSF